MPDQRNKFNRLIGERIKLAREELDLTQEELSQKLGFNSRQTLHSIETGARKMTADELLLTMKKLGKSLEYFTDPFLILGENVFSWRADKNAAIDNYEKKARKIIGAFHHFCELLGDEPSSIEHMLKISVRSSFEDAQDAGERLKKELELGEVPAVRLAEIIENCLQIFVLFVDAPKNISGAACCEKDMKFILINRNEPAGRRNYDLAHELFHILTWDEISHEKLDEGGFERGSQRAENLADNFAAALLMPERSLKKQWEKNSSYELIERINVTAKQFQVSSMALKFRLQNLGLIHSENVISESKLKWEDAGKTPQLYSKTFVKKLCSVLEKGLVSVRKTADLLECSIEDLGDLINSYGMRVSFDM